MSESNCPNCDAVLSYEGGLHCDYCGARFERPEDGDMVEFRDCAGDVVFRYRISPSDYPSPANLETR